MVQSFRCRTVTGIAFSGDQRAQTGEGFWDDTVDGGEVNDVQCCGGILKGIPFRGVAGFNTDDQNQRISDSFSRPFLDGLATCTGRPFWEHTSAVFSVNGL